MDLSLVIHADHLLRGDEAPVRDGALVLDSDARVVEVGPAVDVVPRHAGATVERVRGVVFPGLVNAHTHLELSALRGQVPGGHGFVAWVERLIGARTELLDEDTEAAIAAGVDALLAAGTVAVGEVTNGLGAVGALARAGLDSTSSLSSRLPLASKRLRRKCTVCCSWILPQLWSSRSTSSQSPSGVTIFHHARLSSAVPHSTAFLPPAFIATLPPMQEALAEVGSTANTRPASVAASATRSVTTPAPVRMVA